MRGDAALIPHLTSHVAWRLQSRRSGEGGDVSEPDSSLSAHKPRRGDVSAGATRGVGLRAAEAHRLSQAVLAAMLTRDILAVWTTLDLAHVLTSWENIRTAVISLIRSGAVRALADSERYYADMRALAGVPGDIPGLIPREMPLPLLRATIDMTGPGRLLGDIKRGQPIIQAMDRAGVNLAGASTRLVQQAGRDAVTALVANDQKAVGWSRITSGMPCAFCAMLASRGPVYKTEKQAGFRAHNHCACTAMPVFRKADGRTPDAKALYEAWKRVTKGQSGADAFRAWRRYWDSLEGGLASLPEAA